MIFESFFPFVAILNSISFLRLYFVGRTCHDLLCGVTCSRVGEASLEAALLPFGSVLGIVFGKMEAEERADDDSSPAPGPTAVYPLSIRCVSMRVCRK